MKITPKQAALVRRLAQVVKVRQQQQQKGAA
jgi:hypothetical protein